MERVASWSDKRCFFSGKSSVLRKQNQDKSSTSLHQLSSFTTEEACSMRSKLKDAPLCITCLCVEIAVLCVRTFKDFSENFIIHVENKKALDFHV
jgi:hypothetical protein